MAREEPAHCQRSTATRPWAAGRLRPRQRAIADRHVDGLQHPAPRHIAAGHGRFSPVPSTTNPLGAKGVGEGVTVASTPTVMNAILDALAPLGVTDVPMPATPERIRRAGQNSSSCPAPIRAAVMSRWIRRSVARHGG